MVSSWIAEMLERRAFRCLAQGSSSRAISHLRWALTIREATRGEESFDAANTLTLMAGVLAMHECNQDAAAPLWLKAVDIYQRVARAGPNANAEKKAQDIRIALKGNLENLAVYYYGRGEFAQAELFFQRAMDVLREQLGSDAGRGICNITMFADSLARQGKGDELGPLIGIGESGQDIRAAAGGTGPILEWVVSEGGANRSDNS